MKIQHPNGIIEAEINLPASKSISNRALIVQAIEKNIQLQNLSTADDTKLMQHALSTNDEVLNLKNAGTCVRFLTAYFSATNNHKIITASERMKQRPVSELVQTLKQLGAQLQHTETENKLPIEIYGMQLNGSSITVDASQSSQFVSALMLIAPLLNDELKIKFKNEIVSVPYIEMTAKVMQHFGVNVKVNSQEIIIPQHQTYKPQILTIEPDYSAASYWYQIAALSKSCNIFLRGLTKESWQGDSVVTELMRDYFSVETRFENGGARLTKTTKTQRHEEINLINNPDLTPALAATAAGLGQKIKLTGLQTLSYKESDRLTALGNELSQIANILTNQNRDELTIQHSTFNIQHPTFKTYADHRLAMSFAPLALCFNSVEIDDADCVEKSYPTFWEDLKQAGFVLS